MTHPHLLLLHALSPLHVGTGHTPGAIDLPIARDKATGFPLVPGSGLKGAMRSNYVGDDKTKVFGPETTNASGHAGGLWVGDAHLLCLPIRSVVGTFAWVTSPYLLQRFARDAREADMDLGTLPAGPSDTSGCQVAHPSSLVDDDRVYFEDLDFKATADPRADGVANRIANLLFAEAAWRERFKGRFAVVHDDVMAYLSVHGTDVVTRIRLDNDTKTVANGALWSEESLPTESLLAALVVVAPNKGTHERRELAKVLADHDGETLQIGGDATIGRGRCRLRVHAGGAQ